jgi:hypothetical protein
VAGQAAHQTATGHAPLDAAHGEAVVAHDTIGVVDEHEGAGRVLALGDERVIPEPPVQGVVARIETGAAVVLVEAFDPHLGDAPEPLGPPGQLNEGRIGLGRSVEGFQEALVGVVGEPDGAASVDDLPGAGDGLVEHEPAEGRASQSGRLGDELIVLGAQPDLAAPLLPIVVREMSARLPMTK